GRNTLRRARFVRAGAGGRRRAGRMGGRRRQGRAPRRGRPRPGPGRLGHQTGDGRLLLHVGGLQQGQALGRLRRRPPRPVGAALWRRERTGRGAVVDASLLASGYWAMQGSLAGAVSAGRAELPKRARTENTNPLVLAYPTADGRFVSLMMLGSDRYWPGLCQA